MDRDFFEDLIGKPEGRFVDYKTCVYDFSGNGAKKDSDFIKDVLSFANTVRDSSAYIIFGIREENDGNLNLVGIEKFLDDSIFQQKSSSKIYPTPYFLSYNYKYDDKLFGIIEFPVHYYERPLVSVEKGLKGIEVDKVYVRNGSSNSEATFTQIQELTNWLHSLKTKRYLNSLEDEISTLILEFSNPQSKLSLLLSRCYRLRKLLNNVTFNSFVESELMGVRSKSFDQSDFLKYREVHIPVTPYEITIQNFGRFNADQMIDFLLEDNRFRGIDFVFNKSISEIEQIIEDLKNQPKLLLLSEPNKIVFPDTVIDVKNATLYIGPQMMNNLYMRIRKNALKLLNEIDT